MTSQDIKKQLKEPHFWNIVLTGQHAEPRTKAMLEAKEESMKTRNELENEERNTLQKSYRLLQPEVILQELPDRCNQNK